MWYLIVADAIVTSKMHQYVGPSGKIAEPEDPIRVCKCLHQPAFSSGKNNSSDARGRGGIGKEKMFILTTI